MLVFGLCFNFWWSVRLVDRLKPHRHPSPAKKMKCSFSDYVQLLMIGQWTQTPFASPLQAKNEMLVFGLCSTSDDWPGWLMDSNPICHPSPAKKIKCSFLDYVSTSDDRPGWLIDSNPICHPSPAQKMKCSFSDYVQLLMIGQWTQTPSRHPSPAKK